jgi:formylglycine-generating enzyme required for sulfatase activity
MLCLNCRRDGISISAQVCPHCGVHLPSLMRDLLPPGTLVQGGNYRIDYALGQGGFGITYRAVDLNLERPVAIKEFYPQSYVYRDGNTGGLSISQSNAESYGRWLGRFEREGRILARLNHPGIVKVYSLFKENSTAYLVMELLQGKTLRDELDAQPGKKLPWGRVEAMAAAMVAALETVHREGVYHLDLKPDNVMLTTDGRIVLVDFGAARQDLSQDPKQKSSTRALTPQYAPLELLNGQPLGPESDLFELGMILHESLTGECPPTVLNRLSQERWEPMTLGEPWRDLLTQALRLERANRPQSVAGWWQGYSPSIPLAPEPTVPVIPQPAAAQPPIVETVVSQPVVAETLQEAQAPAKPEVRSTQVEPAQLQRETEIAVPGAKPKQRETQVESPQQMPTRSPQPKSSGLSRRTLILGGLGATGLGGAVIWGLANQNSGPVNEFPASSESSAASPAVSVAPSLSPAPFSSPATYSYEAVGMGEQRQQKISRYFTEDLGGGVQLEMLEIPAGKFLMGSPASEIGRDNGEGPQYRVSVPRFFMGRFEVTQAQWQQVMGNNPAKFKDENRPVERVSWNDAQEFCKKLSQQTGRKYRLPSGAEWEYACRAGSETKYYFGDDESKLDNYAWFGKNSGNQTHPVGSFLANEFGLHDMHGNVWEWCEDVYHGNYQGAPTDGSAWVTGGVASSRILRGGSWNFTPNLCRSAYREGFPTYHRNSDRGFRLAVTLP